MRRILVLSASLLLLPSTAFATWSILAVDRATGRVVMAAASCVNTTDEAMKTAIAVVVPGKGIAACQAAADNTHQEPDARVQRATERHRPGRHHRTAEPRSELPEPAVRHPRSAGARAGHTGLSNGYVAQHVSGQVPGTEIFYSIQANIMRPGFVVPNAVQAFIHAQGAITDRVMAAMEAADGSGGDSRCTCPPWPADGTKPPIACDGRASHVAFILMAEKTDSSGDSHNNGRYALYITVSQPGPDNGPNQIKPGENLNPVKTLRLRYDAWRKSAAGNVPIGSARVGQVGRVGQVDTEYQPYQAYQPYPPYPPYPGHYVVGATAPWGCRCAAIGHLAGANAATRISCQSLMRSASSTAHARHAQMTACTISTPAVSSPVTPRMKRPSKNTSATA